MDQEDFRGFSLKESLGKVFVDFSSTKAADPNSGVIEAGKGYAFMVSRAGTILGKINVCVGKLHLFKKQSSANLKIKEYMTE